MKKCIYSLLLVLAACGGGSGAGTVGGIAPTISALSFVPNGVYVKSSGEQTTVSGTISLSDPDGERSSVTLNVLKASDQTVVSEATLNAQPIVWR